MVEEHRSNVSTRQNASVCLVALSGSSRRPSDADAIVSRAVPHPQKLTAEQAADGRQTAPPPLRRRRPGAVPRAPPGASALGAGRLRLPLRRCGACDRRAARSRPTPRRSRSSRTRSSSSRGSPNYSVQFSLEDADLAELVASSPSSPASASSSAARSRTSRRRVYSPQKVTVAEAYQAFLSILETNGLTVVPHGRFLKIVETAASRRRARRSTARRKARPPRTATSRASTASAHRAPTTSRTCSASSSRRKATSPSTRPATCSSSPTPARTSAA